MLAPAKTLGEAFRVLTPDPLTNPEELEAYYAKTEDTGFKQLYVALRNSDPLKPIKWLVTGHRGNGKSTEFYRLMLRLQQHYFVIYVDANEELDLNDIAPVDLLTMIGARVYTEARQANVTIPEDKVRSLFERLRQFPGAPEPSRLDVEATIGAKLNLLFAEISVQLSKAFGFREELRTYLSSNYSELLQQFNALIACVAEQVQPLLVIVDSMDRLNPERALEVFHRSDALQAIGCKAIYTPPLSIFYSQDFSQIRIAFDDYSLAMPNIKVSTRTGKAHRQGQDILRQMILNRLEESLIAPDALTRLIKVSGGLPRQLFTLARDACTFALIDEEEQIRLPHVSLAETQSRNLFGNILTPEDYSELCTIYKGEREIDNTPQRAALLHKLVLFQYMNAESWFDVNPILQPLLKKRCHESSVTGA